MVIVCKDAQPLNANSPIISTLPGIVIACKDAQPLNAFHPISFVLFDTTKEPVVALGTAIRTVRSLVYNAPPSTLSETLFGST